MANTFTLTAGANSIDIRLPDFGYTVDISMPIYTADSHPNSVKFFDVDSTGTNDYRVLMCNLLLTTIEKNQLNDFLKDADKGRCENITMTLGVTP